MEPRNSFPDTVGSATPERAGASVGIENAPNTLNSPEVPTTSPEQAPSAEQLAVDHTGGLPLPSAPVPPVSQPPITAQSTVVATPPTATPTTAGDSDRIEKEWIDKVKQIISVTADDPHAQQREMSRLVADYVLKRTGRKIGEDGG
jgi:hypothetical protein